MTVTDPVCQRPLPLEEAVAGEDFDGWAYFFCSAACHARFKETPATFAGRAPRAPSHPSF